MPKNTRVLLFCAMLVIPAVVRGAPVEVVERLTCYDGRVEDGLRGLTLDGDCFVAPGTKVVPRGDAQTIEFRVERKGAAPDAAPVAEALSELARAQLAKARDTAARFPGVPGIILVDDGEFIYHKDGTDSYRYHFAGLVLKEDMKGWAQVSLGFAEGRNRARVSFARSVAPDGSVSTLSEDMMKTGSPSEDMEFFNPDHKVLSGTIPGVEVGCVVEYAYEYDNYNPEDPRLFSPGFYFQGTEPVLLSRAKVIVPKDAPFQYATRNFPEGISPEPVVEKAGSTTSYTWTFEDMAPIVPEPYMPPEPDVLPRMEGTVFRSFDELNGLLAGLQKARLKRTPAIEAKVAEIVQGAQTLDDKIARIYYWVQENTRYISIKGSLGAGFTGHTAQETFENRYGDCTDKSILFTTMLDVVGVKAYPVILNTNDAGEVVTEIPTLGGNHCITELCLPGRSFYLDSTAQDYRYPYFREDDHGAWALDAILGKLERIPVPPPEDNRRSSHLDVRLAANGDAEVRTRNEYTGNIEAGVRGFWKQVRDDNRKPMMAQYVNSICPGAVLEDFTLSKLEDLSLPLTMTMDYALPGHGIRAKDLMYLRIPTLERDYEEAALETRRYPIQYITTEERALEIDLELPPGFHAKWLPPPPACATPYFEFKASYDERDGKILYRETFRRLQRIVPVEAYPAYRDALRAIAAFSRQEIFLTEKG